MGNVSLPIPNFIAVYTKFGITDVKLNRCKNYYSEYGVGVCRPAAMQHDLCHSVHVTRYKKHIMLFMRHLYK